MNSLSRKKANRTSMLRNLATSLILYERITTTNAKTKEVKPIVEHLLNACREGDLIARRRLLGYLFDENAVKKVLEDLLPRYKDIKSGMIKTYKLNRRLGDGAELTIVELQKGKITEESTNGKENTDETKVAKGKLAVKTAAGTSGTKGKVAKTTK